jgi:futalosine hydrolase
MTVGDRWGILVVAATDFELCGHEGLVSGIGPVEAALTMARELASDPPQAVLNIGVAGSRGLTPGSLVVGTEAVYCDLSAAIPVVDRARPDPELMALAHAGVPEAVALPIATSATVGGSNGGHETFRAEGMEGFAVLRACEIAGIPAVEVRAISNDISQPNRSQWMISRALDVLEGALPRLLAAMNGSKS